jgi:hypothetical protein
MSIIDEIWVIHLQKVDTLLSLPSFVKMTAFWAEMGVAYLEINKLPCLHEIDIPKCINVYSIYRTKLGVLNNLNK